MPLSRPLSAGDERATPVPRSAPLPAIRVYADDSSPIAVCNTVPTSSRRIRSGDIIVHMPMPALDVAAILAYTDQRVPPHAIHQVRVEAIVGRGAVTIVERRAPWRPEFGAEWTIAPVARLRYTVKHPHWTLYWRDRNHRWHRYPYPYLDPTADVMMLLDEIEQDPTGIFWG
jgi:Protein of unknown function (DUF3024)